MALSVTALYPLLQRFSLIVAIYVNGAKSFLAQDYVGIEASPHQTVIPTVQGALVVVRAGIPIAGLKVVRRFCFPCANPSSLPSP